MPVQINEVIIRAIITGNENDSGRDAAPTGSSQPVSALSKDELLEIIEEVINSKKER
jgi:hypothetical protein